MKELAIVNGSVYQNHGFHKTNVYIRRGLIDVITPEFLPFRGNPSTQADFIRFPGLDRSPVSGHEKPVCAEC